MEQLKDLEYPWDMADHMQDILQLRKLIKEIYLEELLVFQLMLMGIKLLEWHYRQENSI